MNSNPFDIAEELYQKEKSLGQQKSEIIPMEKYSENPFDIAEKQYEKEIDFPEWSEGDIERAIERNQARYLSRGLESVLGTPGNIFSFIQSLTGGRNDILPTSESLQKTSEKLTGGYTTPHSDFEKSADEFVSDVASFALPGAKQYSLMRNIGIPLVGTLAKEGIKYANDDEKNASAAKIATMIGLDLITHRRKLSGGKGLFGGGVKSFSGNLFRQAEEAIPEGTKINGSKLHTALNVLEDSLTKGGESPTTSKALKKISEIRNEIAAGSGKIDAKRLAAYRPSINEIIESLGGFNVEVPRKLVPKTTYNLNRVKEEVVKALSEYGKEFNPKFGQLHKAANESWSAYENSNKISQFLKKKGLYVPKNPVVKSLLGLPGVGGTGYAFATHPGLSAIGGGVTLAGSGIYKSYKVLDRIMKSPTLRGYYTNILNGALKGNIGQVSRNLKYLDNKLSNEDEVKL